MRYIFSFIIFSFLAVSINAQEQSTYSQYYLHPALVNPGVTGYDNTSQIFFNFRNSWAAFDGAPNTYTLHYETPVGERLGLGGQLMAENYGATNRYKFQLNYAYRFNIEKLKVGLGLSTEFQQFRISNDALTSPFYEDDDPIIMEGADGVRFFDATFGAYANHEDGFYFGFAFPNMIRARLDEAPSQAPAVEKNFYYLLMVGYKIDIEKYDFTIEPSMYAKRVHLAPPRVDFNVKLGFLEDKLIGGLSYSLGADNRVGFLIGTSVNKFNLYYSYDYSLERFQQYNSGLHEFTVGYSLAPISAN